MGKLEAVPDIPDHRPRTQITSFRIPTTLMDKIETEAHRLDISKSSVYLRALTDYFETFSSWETDDGDDFYDPKRFYTRGSDKQGHSYQIRTNLPKPMAGEIAAIIESRAVPQYRSVGDFVRDATYHRAKQISRAIDSAELEYAVDMAMLASDEIRLIEDAEQAEHLIDLLRTNAQTMWARGGSRKQLKRYLATKKEIADSIPELYRPAYLDAIGEFEKRIEKVEGKTERQRRRRG